MKRRNVLWLCILAALALCGCNLSLADVEAQAPSASSADSTAQGSTEPAEPAQSPEPAAPAQQSQPAGEYCTVRLSVNTMGGGIRAVLPQYRAEDLYYKLSYIHATIDLETGTYPKPEDAPGASYDDIISAELTLLTGEYIFGLNAYTDSACKKDSLVLFATIEKNLTDASAELQFSLEECNDAEGNGTVSVTVQFPADGGVDSVSAKLVPLSGSSFQDAENSLAITTTGGLSSACYEHDDVPSGTYMLFFTLDSAGTKTVFPEVVTVKPGATSSAQIPLTYAQINTRYTLSLNNLNGDGKAAVHGSFVHGQAVSLPIPTHEGYAFCGWYRDADFSGTPFAAYTAESAGNEKPSNITLYGRWVSTTLYVSAGGSNDKDAQTETAAVGTLDKAVSLLNTYTALYTTWRQICGESSAALDWTVQVSGTVRGCTSLGTLNAASLTLTGKTGAATDALDGEQKGSVLTITTAVPVTIKNLTIQNGKAENGGGINIVSGTLTLGTGAVISGNTATGYGGGVYVNSGGNGITTAFTMSGSALIASDNDVYLPSGKTLTVGGALTATAPVATITLPAASYAAGTPVLTGTTALLASEHGKFALTQPAGGSGWSIDLNGKLAFLSTLIGTKSAPDTIGDIVFSDGSAAFYDSITEEQRQAARGIKCSDDYMLYINAGFTQTTWDIANYTATDHGGLLPDPATMAAILRNLTALNNALQALYRTQILSGSYWTSEEFGMLNKNHYIVNSSGQRDVPISSLTYYYCVVKPLP